MNPSDPDALPVDRRVFLKGASAAAAASAFISVRRSIAAPTATAQSLVAGKDARLLVHVPQPAVFETPVELLAGEQITPTPLLFVRNNQQPAGAATMKPLQLAGWKIELAGLVDHRQTIEAGSLAELPQVEQEMVLQCSGNGRMLFATTAATKGTQWGRGAMGNVRFGGVRLATLLDRYGVKIKPEAKFLTAEGNDGPAPGEQDFEHSVPLDEALNKSLLALRLNGEPLPAIHGGPVRLVTPGYYGTMHVKWLNHLRFESQESDHTSQVPHYRTPRAPITRGQPFTSTFENSEPNWRMKIKCVVLAPAAGARLAAGDISCSGVAFNDGQARIEKVLVSADAGRTWQAAQLEVPKSLYAWYRWQARLKLAAGKQQIWALAIDAWGRSQPLDGSIHWNPQGYTWNGVEKIDIHVA
jgi:DMSO/TMAO reductase YedYZ molybdopterin-dependent catalytic subunit